MQITFKQNINQIINQPTVLSFCFPVKPVTTDEEYKETERIVGEFGQGIGQELHKKLLERAKAKKNWLEDWWRDRVYLTNRTPLGVCSMYGANRTMESFWPPCIGTNIERAAISTWYMLRYFEELRRESIPVEKSKTGKMIFSMDQARSMFNGSRIPGPEADQLINSFRTEREGSCPNHMLVSCNGHLFRVDPFDSRGKLVSSRELARQLQNVKERSMKRGQCMSSLTGDERSRYADNHKHLKSLHSINEEYIKTIDSAIALLALDDSTPCTYTELVQETVSGRNVHNHWLDKSVILIVYKNGCLSCISDHAPYDAMVCVDMIYWGYKKMEQNGGIWPDTDCEVRGDLAQPQELVFVTDPAIENAIVTAEETHYRAVDNVDILCSYFLNLGKDWCKQYRIHPDFLCQLAIQLAYYKMYRRPAATYETATTRQFYHGRTETCRSCSSEALAWCKSMVEPEATKAEQAELLKAAYIKHFSLMSDAMQNKGCDRHLLGLYFISDELGMPPPDIFLDQGFIKSGGGGNFTLSTSLSGYKPFLGVVPPMCLDGYFISYRILNDKLEFVVVTCKNSTEADNLTMFKHITQSLIQIKDLTMQAASKL
nr:peroxisomal carnitine O-octanoyltransferase-like [Lytechinus pictus]